jgi:predicted Zn finger-like uncharacterized protein
MTISVACPSCESGLKVKEELAGRKVKCPKCGSPIDVPEEEAAASANEYGRPRKKKRHDDEDAPRKKRKKKRSNTGLLIGLLVGGALLIIAVVVVLIIINAKEKEPSGGEQAKGKVDPGPRKKAEPEKKDEGGQPVPEPKEPVGDLKRAFDIETVKNHMRQIGLAYHNYITTFNRAPMKWQDLKPYYENNTDITEMLEKGWYVFIPKVMPQHMTQGTSNTILAYERYGDRKGLRVVVMGDGSIQIFDEQEFKKTPKAGEVK